MERLRHLARAGSLEHAVLVQEGAAALAALGDDRAALLLACRRLLERHRGSGPLWSLCARMLCSDDPRSEAWACTEEIDGDETAAHLASELLPDATVVVLGWPELAAPALARRGDLRVLVVDAPGDGVELVRWLRQRGVDAVEVPPAGVAAAVAGADQIVLEADAVGPHEVLAVVGSVAAAAVAAHVGSPVWVVAGAGRVLPPALWVDAVLRQRPPAPWLATREVVALALAGAVVRPDGLVRLPAMLPHDCPFAPELLSSSPGGG